MVRPVAGNRAAAGNRIQTLLIKVRLVRIRIPVLVKVGERDGAAVRRGIAVRAARDVVAVTVENNLRMPGNKNARYSLNFVGIRLKSCLVRYFLKTTIIKRIFLNIVFVAKDFSRFYTLAARLRREQEVQLVPATIGVAVLEQLKGKPMDVVIVDEQLDDMTGIDFVKQLVMINPIVNTAIIGGMSKKDFHEATEGMGVLMQLPRYPQERDAEELLAITEKISGLLQPKIQQVSP